MLEQSLSRIVIVEDSATQAQQVAAHLSDFVNVLIATDGPQALRLISNLRPDLVVLDINLPTMNGYQVCRRLKRDAATQDIPVIMLTSATEAEDMMRGIEAGAIDYIPKDEFAVDHLLQTLAGMGLLRGMT